MNYTLHQLKVFLQVCKRKSVTKAAEDLHLTQPAVSIQLKKLQDQFEIPLTEVIGRQIYITNFGEKIAEVSARILGEAEEIKTTLNQYKGLLTGKLNISSASTGKYVIPYFLTKFTNKYPGVEINIDVTNKNKVLESLSANATDFALVSVLPENIPVDTLNLLENRLYLVASKEQPLAQKSEVFPEDLNEVQLIFREQGSATRAAMERFLKENQITTTKSMELVSNEAVKQAVNAALGYSVMPLIGLRNELINGSIKIIPIKGLPITTNWNLVYNKGKKLSPACQAFVDFIEEHKNQIIEEKFSWTRDFK